MRSSRVLIVDDHFRMRQRIRALLISSRRWRICGEAAEGPEAVRKVRRTKPDVVLMDLSLPDSGGLGFMRSLAKAAPSSKVLVLTPHHAPKTVQKLLTAGARGFVLTSAAERELVAALEALREGRLFITPSVSRGRRGSKGELRGAAARPGGALGLLTSRERDVLELVAAGNSNKEAAALLGISVRTVETHRAKIMRKLTLESYSDLVRFAVRAGLVAA